MISVSMKRFAPVFLVFFTLTLFGIGVTADTADARSRSGGRSFSSAPAYKKPPAQSPAKQYNTPGGSGGFMRGLAGGLVGGAIGSMLFGGLANAGAGGGIGGSGIGLLQIIIFAALAYFIYSRFIKKRMTPAHAQYQQTMTGPSAPFAGGMPNGGGMNYPPPPPAFGNGSLTDGIDMIRRSEPAFDPEYFKEVAQDVFFQVQAGWMRRDIQSYRHLLGQRLATEYESHFAEMQKNGQINKLENIAVRKVEVVAAGSDGNEEFVSVLFTANLLDYTVDEQSSAIIRGSNTEPVKFAEKWTWARPAGTEIWKLEGIEVMDNAH
ncbi:MAG: TIM44-like domain-containing protein [Deltaproteobacteria bacterium]|nr:TIM44-like domain-containing protein [Deltaproteobacteria bacterium]